MPKEEMPEAEIPEEEMPEAGYRQLQIISGECKSLNVKNLPQR